ncbi:MAG: hypothetical protein H0U44_02255 [Flavisolibacter sp.]|jgi:hypothetical protein|nr:hypothetical protein [Flavisolibacter sp.]
MKNFIFLFCLAGMVACNNSNSEKTQTASSDSTQNNVPAGPQEPRLDSATYRDLQNNLANGDTTGRWPVMEPYPVPGAILPFKRVIAYYGNLYSNRMGALGKWPKQEMMKRLMDEVQKWTDADSTIPAIPALHYICVTAQAAPGKDGKYRFRMPNSQIDTILSWAKEINAEVFLDVQVGLSDFESEIPALEKYLSMPNVHLGIDPEFAMKAKGNKKPGSVIGTVDAADINYITEYLAGLVKKHNLPAKMFMIHRFTQGMVTNYKNIKLYPELQIIMDMDGWGNTAKKKSTYYSWISPQPVQFTGFKLFYVNDTEYSNQAELMTREEILNLRPKPIYIQYQ